MRYSIRQKLAAGAAGALSTGIFGLMLRHLRHDCRWHLRGPLDDLLAGDRPLILAVWHQDVLLLLHYLAITTFLEHRRPMVMLASRSFDGEITRRLMRAWGFRFVRGSTGKRGAHAALRGLRRALDGGSSVVIVADGPLPPPFVMQSGPIYLARATGVPLYLARAWARPQVLLSGSWFRMAIPVPRARCALFSSGPVDVGGAPEDARLRAEAELNRLCVEADRRLYLHPRVTGGVRLDVRRV